MKCFVYIVRCANGRYYTGSAIDIERRILEHNSGKTPSLKNVLPVTLVFSQEFDRASIARKIEYLIKKKKSRAMIEKIIHEGQIKFVGP